ncbi:unnamed protein product [Didymodactylos carnosus]|uniref:Secreted protein n=1 Tax=Didymodactylos carnosus TaxID=1234261 RepID=A0A814Q8I1_9BILA|nr:unnamed protein product [Didymodactylos carnosus]CAF3880659.1 unnamed protein product [Didymodactylos carnosus]
MKTALAIIFVVRLGACLATDYRLAFIDQLLEQRQLAAQSMLNLLSQQLQNLANSLDNLLEQLIGGFINQLSGTLGSILNLSSILGGRGSDFLSTSFDDFFQSISDALGGLGDYFVNQRLSAVLGAICGGCSIQDISDAGQTALSGIVNNLTGVVSEPLAGLKPH